MQIAATPQRSPDSRSRFARVPDDPGTRGAERVADGDGAALGVDDVGVGETLVQPGVDAGERLDGERLVELDGADLGPGDARASERDAGGLDRREAEQLRLEREGASPGDPGLRLQTEHAAAAAEPSRSGGRAVVERGGVAGRDRAVRTEAGLQSRELLGGAPGPDPLVAGRSTPGTGTTRSS